MSGSLLTQATQLAASTDSTGVRVAIGLGGLVAFFVGYGPCRSAGVSRRASAVTGLILAAVVAIAVINLDGKKLEKSTLIDTGIIGIGIALGVVVVVWAFWSWRARRRR